MPLSVSQISATIVQKLDAQNGQPPQDAAVQKKFADAIAEALFEVLTTQASVSSTGTTLPGPPGGPLPIANLPGILS